MSKTFCQSFNILVQTVYASEHIKYFGRDKFAVPPFNCLIGQQLQKGGFFPLVELHQKGLLTKEATLTSLSIKATKYEIQFL